MVAGAGGRLLQPRAWPCTLASPLQQAPGTEPGPPPPAAHLQVTQSVQSFLMCFTTALLSVVVVVTISPAVLAAAVVLGFFYYFVQVGCSAAATAAATLQLCCTCSLCHGRHTPAVLPYTRPNTPGCISGAA
jgi:hypothetical protein